jgi:hypothetical protein
MSNDAILNTTERNRASVLMCDGIDHPWINFSFPHGWLSCDVDATTGSALRHLADLADAAMTEKYPKVCPVTERNFHEFTTQDLPEAS